LGQMNEAEERSQVDSGTRPPKASLSPVVRFLSQWVRYGSAARIHPARPTGAKPERQ
jgi:hypothetical protein